MHPNVPLILFAKGANHSFELLMQAPYDVYGLDWTGDVQTVRRETKGKTLQGNLHPVALFAGKVCSTYICLCALRFTNCYFYNRIQFERASRR